MDSQQPSQSYLPKFDVSLETADGSSEVKRVNGDLRKYFRVAVTYHEVESVDPAFAKPITLHSHIFHEDAYYSLYYRRCDDNGLWEYCGYHDICLNFADNPDIEVNVADSKDFVTIYPGETWVTTVGFYDDIWEVPDDLQPGDMFRFLFKGAAVDWWDWGDKNQVHTQTTVTMDGIGLGFINDPTDNGGRPEIKIPSSDEVLFTFVE